MTDQQLVMLIAAIFYASGRVYETWDRCVKGACTLVHDTLGRDVEGLIYDGSPGIPTTNRVEGWHGKITGVAAARELRERTGGE